VENKEIEGARVKALNKSIQYGKATD